MPNDFENEQQKEISYIFEPGEKYYIQYLAPSNC